MRIQNRNGTQAATRKQVTTKKLNIVLECKLHYAFLMQCNNYTNFSKLEKNINFTLTM